MTTHYQTLGVAETATGRDIRAAYVAKAQVLHPDRNGGSAAQMQAINTAWAVLGDPDKRRQYDLQLHPRPSAPTFQRDTSGIDEESTVPLEAAQPARFHMLRSAPTIIVLVVAAGLFVVSAFAGGGSGDPVQRPATAIEVGDCVTEAAGSIRMVPCDGSTTGIAEAIVDNPEACITRTGTHPVQLPTNPKYACVGPPG